MSSSRQSHPGYSSSGSLPSPATSKTCMSAAAKRAKYLRRLLHFRQMDFEFAVWQMIYLLLDPKRVYRNFKYRKLSKSQFARDDPAFLVLLSSWLLVSTGIYSWVLQIHFSGFIKFLLWVIGVDTLGMGCIVATGLWLFTNKYLLVRRREPEEAVEWGYCLDIHLNALFPVLVILHGVQLLFYHHFISGPGIVATLLGNTLWLVALTYYIFITFLGYGSLSGLKKTRIFLYPLGMLILLYFLTLFTGVNLCQVLARFYKDRVV
ncbi:Protein unc-50 -like protein [Caligus rogercresseyi]|uniref:Protein unc-50 -like protein n=1 Tax=Caligus rogercresseyi TaxID=217165 RepID=A0A7T8KJF5_CALRO|nr:Protein unc-50 -like protein [Caligus rogercresseyi]|eukprot:TRINITY_DN7559_c0_g1_i1.p1 TRINITY_DN7559_c0_g1~~TRINITY_DN7559_c0_g1_i1.p1  ORF type:complete len:263 (+),score=61.01 TRINITY_DN7559_c0_g1_i1:60-848(+)